MTPKYVLNFFLYEPTTFLVLGSTWTSGLSKPMGLADYDLRCVAFLVLLDIDGEGTDLGGGELAGAAMCLL